MIVLATREHLDALEMPKEYIARLAADPLGYQRLLHLLRQSGACAVMRGDTVMAVMGFHEWYPGVLNVWAYPSVHIPESPVLYLKMARRYIAAIEKSHQPRRLQTEAIADDFHDRWMTFLGFRKETPDGLKNYTPLFETVNLWAKTYEDHA